MIGGLLTNYMSFSLSAVIVTEILLTEVHIAIKSKPSSRAKAMTIVEMVHYSALNSGINSQLLSFFSTTAAILGGKKRCIYSIIL